MFPIVYNVLTSRTSSMSGPALFEEIIIINIIINDTSGIIQS